MKIYKLHNYNGLFFDFNISKDYTLLLNISNHFNLLEKTVYDIAMFHFKRLNIEFDQEKYFIEFWLKSKTKYSDTHVDCDEYEREHNHNYIHPICSCVTYINDHPCPTVITPINLESYTYKDFPQETQLYFSFPKEGKHIAFDGSFFHCAANLDHSIEDTNRNILCINLWDRKPTNLPYYVSNEESIYSPNEPLINMIECNEKHRELFLHASIFNDDFWENILYHKKNEAFLPLKEIFDNQTEYYSIYDISNNYSSDTFILTTKHLPIMQKKMNQELIEKYGNIINDITPILCIDKVEKSNRFYKHYIFREIYSPDICKWMILETEKYAEQNGGWTKKRHTSYPTTDIPAINIPHIYSFITITLNTIYTKVRQLYSIPESINFGINDIFLVKYDENDQRELVEHKDGSFISFNIMLSDYSEYQGGGTYFVDDNTIVFLNQGDMLLHHSRILHAGKEVTHGKRYILVFFIDLLNIHSI